MSIESTVGAFPKIRIGAANAGNRIEIIGQSNASIKFKNNSADFLYLGTSAQHSKPGVSMTDGGIISVRSDVDNGPAPVMEAKLYNQSPSTNEGSTDKRTAYYAAISDGTSVPNGFGTWNPPSRCDLNNYCVIDPNAHHILVGGAFRASVTNANAAVDKDAIAVLALANASGANNSAYSFYGEGQLYNEGVIKAIGADVIAYATSDARYKDNVKLITKPLEKLSQIRGVTFDWNDKAPAWTRQDKFAESRRDVGVIAQEVQKVLPEVIDERKDGYLAVNYEKMVPLLIESIKELEARIKELENASTT